MREQTYAVTHRGYCRGYSRGYSRGYNGAIVGLFDLPNPCEEKKKPSRIKPRTALLAF